jgi:hypothetical protein
MVPPATSPRCFLNSGPDPNALRYEQQITQGYEDKVGAKLSVGRIGNLTLLTTLDVLGQYVIRAPSAEAVKSSGRGLYRC